MLFQVDSVDPNFASTSFSPRMNSRANITKPSKDGSFSPLQRARQAVARRFTVGRDAVKPNFGSTETLHDCLLFRERLLLGWPTCWGVGAGESLRRRMGTSRS